ncbi:MAG: hypothetical protein ACPGQS_01230 [Bradymonadia bacterium]
MDKTSFGSVVLAVLMMSGVAYGQDVFATPGDAAPAGNVEYRKVTEYDFDADVVEGSFVRPEGEFFSGNGNQAYGSLIRIREDFVPEMLKSAEDI